MPIPDSLMKEASPIIEKIANSRKNKHKFSYYRAEDIHQEIWALCLDALERYNPSFGKLENYLNSHVSNRIKNLKRDRYFRPEVNEVNKHRTQTRINLVNAIPIDDISNEENLNFISSASPENDPFEELKCENLREFIIDKLPVYLVEPFNKLVSGQKIKGCHLKEIRFIVSKIMDEINNG